jgi:hypothetical protein
MKRLSAALSAVLLSAALALCLLSCQQAANNTYITNIISGSPKEENTNFETRSVPFLYQTDSNILFTLFTRIYDKNEYVPYAGVRYWLQTVCDVKFESSSYSDGEYTIVGYALDKTFPIVVNTKNNTIYCSAWAGYLSPDPSLVFDKSAMIDSKKAYDGQRAVTFDLGKYGFKIYSGIDDAYAPVCVLNQLFACALKNAQFLYNGKNFYYYSKGFTGYEALRDSPWYKDENGNLKDRPKELVEASYNLLCFAHDNLYGKPGYYGFADGGNGYAKADVVAAADALSFDDMLNKYDPDTKALLKSSNYVDYLKGLAKLTYYTYGDQHASVKWNERVMFDNTEIENAVNDIIKDGCSDKWKYDRKKSSASQTNSLNWWRKQKGIIDADGEIISDKALELIDGGKTLIIRFDEFNLNQSGGWNAYYATASEEPDPDATSSNLPDDTVTLFYKAFYRIAHKTEAKYSDYKDVKTILIDASCNGGGAKPVMQYILYLITGRGDLYYDDVHTGAKNHEFVKADLNLDGKVDYKDSVYRGNFFGPAASLNVAILTSFSSFSCGNALPFYAKERGVKIIGERSGGGSCIVGHGITADGFPYHFSVNSRLSAQDFSKTVESGAEVDKPLMNGDSYEWFYDYDNPTTSHLIAALKELFGSSY